MKKILLPMFASVMALSMNSVASADDIKVIENEENTNSLVELDEYIEQQFTIATVKEENAVKVRLEGDVQTVAYAGESFKVIGTQGEWIEIQLGEEEAWLSGRYVDLSKAPGYISNERVNFRKEASTESEVIEVLELGTELEVIETSEEWIKVKNGEEEGFVSASYLSEEAPVVEVEEIVESNESNNQSSSSNNTTSSNNTSSSNNTATSNNTTTSNNATSSNNNANPPASSSSQVQAVLNLAYSKQGSPYQWGAEGPNSFDCSGFTSYVFRNAVGVSLPRTSSAQSSYGTTVSKSNLQPGDLVFFNTSGSGVSHVGIYVGNGNMIHSPSSGKTVSVASINSSYYSARFVTAKRVL